MAFPLPPSGGFLLHSRCAIQQKDPDRACRGHGGRRALGSLQPGPARTMDGRKPRRPRRPAPPPVPPALACTCPTLPTRTRQDLQPQTTRHPPSLVCNVRTAARADSRNCLIAVRSDGSAIGARPATSKHPRAARCMRCALFALRAPAGAPPHPLPPTCLFSLAASRPSSSPAHSHTLAPARLGGDVYLARELYICMHVPASLER